MRRPPPQSTLFPYTTLFRSLLHQGPGRPDPTQRLPHIAVDALHGPFPRRPQEPVDDANSLVGRQDRKSTRLNSSHVEISYAVFCLKKKKNKNCRRTCRT